MNGGFAAWRLKAPVGLSVYVEPAGLNPGDAQLDSARKALNRSNAWVTEPNRGVGRRKGTCLSDRISVTLRIDRELWERFTALEAAGVIDDRTALINSWFRQKLAELDREGGRADAQEQGPYHKRCE